MKDRSHYAIFCLELYSKVPFPALGFSKFLLGIYHLLPINSELRSPVLHCVPNQRFSAILLQNSSFLLLLRYGPFIKQLVAGNGGPTIFLYYKRLRFVQCNYYFFDDGNYPQLAVILPQQFHIVCTCPLLFLKALNYYNFHSTLVGLLSIPCLPKFTYPNCLPGS